MRQYTVTETTMPDAIERIRQLLPGQVKAKFKWFNVDGKLIQQPAITLVKLYRDWYGDCELCPENDSTLMDLVLHLPGNKLLAIEQDSPVVFGELMDLLESTMSFRPITEALSRKKSKEALLGVNSRYHSAGIKDSRKEGWYRKGRNGRIETSRLVVETPVGKIIAEVTCDFETSHGAVSFRRISVTPVLQKTSWTASALRAFTAASSTAMRPAVSPRTLRRLSM